MKFSITRGSVKVYVFNHGDGSACLNDKNLYLLKFIKVFVKLILLKCN